MKDKISLAGDLGNEKIRSKMGSKMKDGMIMPYKAMLEKEFPTSKK